MGGWGGLNILTQAVRSLRAVRQAAIGLCWRAANCFPYIHSWNFLFVVSIEQGRRGNLVGAPPWPHCCRRPRPLRAALAPSCRRPSFGRAPAPARSCLHRTMKRYGHEKQLKIAY